MNTKNILKTLALAMLLIPACNKSEIANDENTTKKGFALPVTVNVTREGDDATKATYDDGTKKLSFSAGDKLFVNGSHTAAGQFAGTLDYDAVSGKFSGTIYTESEYTGTAEALLAGADDLMATLLPAGYDTYGYLSIKNEGSYGAYFSRVHNKAFALTKKAALEQFSVEHTISYSSGFALAPDNAIVSFTISGLTANKEVAVSFDREGTGVIGGNVTTSATGVATFAVGVYEYCELENCTLTVAGNNIAMPTKTTAAGKIYNITRAVTPPTLAQTMTTAGMTVEVKYNYEDEENYCLFSSVGDGTYTFQSGDGWAGGDANCAKALVVEGGKLVFKQNAYDTIDDLWSNYGFSVTFDTSNNSYIQFVGQLAQEFHNPSFISVEVNSVPIALTKIITVADLVKEDHQSWSVIITNNSDKIKADDDYGEYVVRISDNAKLQRNMFGDVWQDVTTHDNYQSMDTYKFEGD